MLWQYCRPSWFFGQEEKLLSRVFCFLLFKALAGVDFEDYGMQKKEELIELKKNTLWGVAPILEVDGLTVQQTGAIIK